MIRCTVVDFLEIQLRLKNIVIQNGIVHEGLLRRYYFDNTLSLSRPKKEKKNIFNRANDTSQDKIRNREQVSYESIYSCINL